MKAIIIYQSAYGHVEKMAVKVKEGLESAGLDVILSRAAQTKPEELPAYDVIVLGSPVRMGSIGDEMKAFIDKTGGLWFKSALVDRVGGVFVSGAGYNTGIEMTQLALYSVLVELGMVLVGFRFDHPGYGSGANHWGPFAKVGLDGKDGPTQETFTACFEYGKRLGWAAGKIRG